ncbi:MAG TPA: response regulator [Verrucomicrobiae bacterium]|nr:response regulator [Verrucomicrobiae bacterium]
MAHKALILMVEDQENDALLIRRAFTKSGVLNPIQVVGNGEQAIAYLNGTGPFANRAEFPLPSLVLLDINMPGMDGFELLRWIRRESPFPGLRVVMLASSGEIRDVNRAYQLGANSFLVKPLDFERFAEITQALSGYWLWLDQAPEASRQPETKAVSDTEILRRIGLEPLGDPSSKSNSAGNLL